jgi:hypothetical protein
LLLIQWHRKVTHNPGQGIIDHRFEVLFSLLGIEKCLKPAQGPESEGQIPEEQKKKLLKSQATFLELGNQIAAKQNTIFIILVSFLKSQSKKFKITIYGILRY